MRKIAITGASGFVGRHVIPVLQSRGFAATALVRSPESARKVESLGCEAGLCDMGQTDSIVNRLQEADTVVHMAARLDISGSYQDFYVDNVLLTQRMLEASQQAGVKNFVMIGAAAVAIGSPDPFPLTEEAPLIARPAGHYGTTKALAEKEVLSCVNPHLRRVVLRPPLVWAEDAPVFDSIAESVQKGQFVWINGGRYCVATIHVENLASAILAALSSPGEEGVFFVSDGSDLQFRRLIEAALRAKGLSASRISLPRWVARTSATLAETAWALLRIPGRPPITNTLVDLIGGEFRIDDTRARQRLGYCNRISIARRSILCSAIRPLGWNGRRFRSRSRTNTPTAGTMVGLARGCPG
jgi:nucleoside-diphosphate-sugar epimerase